MNEVKKLFEVEVLLEEKKERIYFEVSEKNLLEAFKRLFNSTVDSKGRPSKTMDFVGVGKYLFDNSAVKSPNEKITSNSMALLSLYSALGTKFMNEFPSAEVVKS